MKRIATLVATLLFLSCTHDYRVGPGVQADVVSDVTPPTLTALSFAPTSANTSNGPATITVSYTVTDDISGATHLDVEFYSPSGPATIVGNGTVFPAALSQTGSFDVTVPQFSESGVWTLAQVVFGDALGNTQVLHAADLSGMGFETALNVFSAVEDHTPPTLTALSFAPTSVNTSNGPATITVSYTVTDDVSGATHLDVQFSSPSGPTTIVGNGTVFPATLSQTGSFDVTVPQFSESGVWTLSQIVFGDALGNTQVLHAADLVALGFPTTLVVQNAIPVTIDIQPGSARNTISASKRGKVTVAILSDVNFDATSTVVRTSFTFGRTGDEASLASCAKEGEDVNSDGFKDLVCQFYAQKTGFRAGDLVGILRGLRTDQLPIEGRDAVRIVK